MFALDGFGSFSDLSLTRKEHQDIAVAKPHQLFTRSDNTIDLLNGDFLFLPILRNNGPHQRAIADFHRVGAPRHLDDGRRVLVVRREMTSEPFRINRRGSDNDFQIWTLRQNML